MLKGHSWSYKSGNHCQLYAGIKYPKVATTDPTDTAGFGNSSTGWIGQSKTLTRPEVGGNLQRKLFVLDSFQTFISSDVCFLSHVLIYIYVNDFS